MSTFPRRVKSPLLAPATSASPYLTRATSDFDAGINSSAAWTEHLERELDSLSLSDGEKGSFAAFSLLDDDETKEGALDGRGDTELQRGRPACALYDFEGKPEFQELSLKAGDELEVLNENLAEGWSLARLPLYVGDSEDEQEELAERGGEVGLVPRSYYSFSLEFDSSYEKYEEDEEHHSRRRDASSNTLTPRASVIPSANSTSSSTPPSVPPLFPQSTGEWFRQQLQLSAVRRSLLGGKSLNRFSSFVTSGAEEWVLNGSPSFASSPTSASKAKETIEGLPLPSVSHTKENTEGSSDSDPGMNNYFIDVGPAWRTTIPSFTVRVHSPEKRLPPLDAAGVGAYTVYSVTSIFSGPSDEGDTDVKAGWHTRFSSGTSTPLENVDAVETDSNAHMITVTRRFSHFVFLHNALSRLLPGITLPPLPEKQYAGRFSDAFVEARRGELERYINKIVRHPIARCAEVLMFFLGCENDVEWRKKLPFHMQRSPAGPSFYANVYHPAFHIDIESAEDTIDRFQNHTRASDHGVSQLRGVFGKVRSARVEMSNAERMLSYSILSLITSTPLASSLTADEEDDDEDNQPSSSQSAGSSNGQKRRSCRLKKGLMDADGAWCWRDDCADCLRLTKCMQKTAETLQGVADLYDGHARRTMLANHESMKDLAHRNSIYAPTMDIHRATLSRYKEATSSSNPNEEMAARCETVLNTTMAELEVCHARKKEDVERITKDYLDNEIGFYEKILNRLQTTRALFDATPQEHELTMPGPRFPSVYERDLANPKVSTAPLPQPCPHVFDSSSMRPVSTALQGVGSLFSPNTGEVANSPPASNSSSARSAEAGLNGRGSVFSRFW